MYLGLVPGLKREDHPGDRWQEKWSEGNLVNLGVDGLFCRKGLATGKQFTLRKGACVHGKEQQMRMGGARGIWAWMVELFTDCQYWRNKMCRTTLKYSGRKMLVDTSLQQLSESAALVSFMPLLLSEMQVLGEASGRGSMLQLPGEPLIYVR